MADGTYTEFAHAWIRVLQETERWCDRAVSNPAEHRRRYRILRRLRALSNDLLPITSSNAVGERSSAADSKGNDDSPQGRPLDAPLSGENP